MRKAIGLVLLAILGAFASLPASPAHADAVVVQSCGTLPLAYKPGAVVPNVQDINGLACTAAAVSASISGFTAASTGTPIAVTTGGVTGTLPSGAVVVATNVGATNGAYCALGASASTSSQYLSPGGGWFAFTVGASTQLTCITSTSTTTVNMTGGTGLPTGTGGGGGGGGGSVTQGTVPWVVSVPTWAGGTLGAMANYGTSPGAVLVPGVNAFVTNPVAVTAAASSYSAGAFVSGAAVDGWDASQGAKADAVCGTATGTCSLIALIKYSNATPPVLGGGSAIIGKVGIDQTTSSVTNGVMNAGSKYQAVAASATATVLGSTGAIGDYLSHCVIYPASTSPGVVTVFDSTNTAPNSAILFAGGASSTSNLTPIAVPVGALSVNGAWKVTTGSSVSVVCYGKFT